MTMQSAELNFNQVVTPDTKIILENVFDPWYYEGKRIYTKNFSIEELIGEIICQEMNIKSVHFEFLESKKNGIVLASRDFYKDNYSYRYPLDMVYDTLGEEEFDLLDDELMIDYLDFFKNLCISQENENFLLQQIFKMFSVDTYMRQEDRVNCNVQLEIDNCTNWIQLAPLYDLECSFRKHNSEFIYRNPFCGLEIDKYKDSFSLYPEFKVQLENVQKLNMDELLRKVEHFFQINIPKQTYNYFYEEEETSQKLLSKILS
ncbi:MAG: hypothetical protein E7168_03655 [Firmicutes bacterium]|nr:hypothetical protein [Bacillota bacterium]